MPSVKWGVAVAALTLSLSACVTVPGSAPVKAGAKSPVAAKKTVIKKAEPEVAPAVRREYENALTALKSGDHKTAEGLFTALSRREPTLSGPHANLALVYARTNRPKEAMNALNKAIEINPDRPAYHNELAILLREDGKFKEARDSYERALAVDSDYAAAHLNLGILYDLYLLEPTRALEHYRRYRDLAPADAKTVTKWIAELEQRLRGPSEKKS
jgi:tetratricopeptide (TPR) repeat protein